MSEQETSRSVGSSSSTSEGGETSQRQEDPNQGPPPPGQCCAVSSPRIDSADNGGMGNTVFSSSPNDHGDDADNSQEKETLGCDSSKDKSSSNDPSDEIVKDTLSEGAGADVDLSCSEDTKMHLNQEASQSGEDNSIPSEQGLEDSMTVFKTRADLEVNEECSGVVDSETKTDSDREKDNGAATEDITSKDYNKSLVSSTECEKVCESDESKSTSAEVVVKDTESICQSDEVCCQSQLRSADTLETQELELAERGEGIVVLSKCSNETHPNPESGEGDGGCDKPYSDEHFTAKGDSSSGNTMESCISAGSSSNIGQHQEGMIGYSLDATSSTSIVGMDSDSVGLMQMCSVGVDEGFNVVVQGCSTMKTDGCYAPGVDLCVADAIRDTDSEAGDSCCSDEEHGEACRGENGCIHRVAGDALDQNWDYMVDEEFNVPRKPIFNGSADQLERRSNLKRKASEEPEGTL